MQEGGLLVKCIHSNI